MDCTAAAGEALVSVDAAGGVGALATEELPPPNSPPNSPPFAGAASIAVEVGATLTVGDGGRCGGSEAIAGEG